MSACCGRALKCWVGACIFRRLRSRGGVRSITTKNMNVRQRDAYSHVVFPCLFATIAFCFICSVKDTQTKAPNEGLNVYSNIRSVTKFLIRRIHTYTEQFHRHKQRSRPRAPSPWPAAVRSSLAARKLHYSRRILSLVSYIRVFLQAFEPNADPLSYQHTKPITQSFFFNVR